MRYVSMFLPGLLVLASLVPLWIVASMWRIIERRQTRHSPLVRDLLRPPGHSLRLQVASLQEDITLHLMMLFVIPFATAVVYLADARWSGTPESLPRAIVMPLAGVIAMGIFIVRLGKLLHRRKNCVLGLEGELATAEELTQLLRDGYWVFHDIPYPYGNIDHVVIGPAGVFTVNTKIRGKPKTGADKAEARVDFSRDMIAFPDGSYSLPTAQLRREARWLAERLAAAVGRPIAVEPMLALPGWFLRRSGSSDVTVFNPRNPQQIFAIRRSILSAAEAQQAAHQVEQLCRDIEPSFRVTAQWSSETNRSA